MNFLSNNNSSTGRLLHKKLFIFANKLNSSSAPCLQLSVGRFPGPVLEFSSILGDVLASFPPYSYGLVLGLIYGLDPSTVISVNSFSLRHSSILCKCRIFSVSSRLFDDAHRKFFFCVLWWQFYYCYYFFLNLKAQLKGLFPQLLNSNLLGFIEP